MRGDGFAVKYVESLASSRYIAFNQSFKKIQANLSIGFWLSM
jgi:hypothetical protein